MMRTKLLLLVTTLIVTLNFKTATAQTVYLEVDGTALYASDNNDCNSTNDNRWRNSVRNSSNGTWNDWNVDQDNGVSGGWDTGLNNGAWLDRSGVPIGDNLQIRMDAFESDGFVCGSDDGSCGGYSTTFNTPITNYGGCTWNTGIETFRTCTSDGSTITWGVRFQFRYYVESANGGTVGSNQSICAGGDPAAFTSSAGATAEGTAAHLGYQWQYQDNCTGGWTDISGANAATYNPPAGLNVTRCYRRRSQYYSDFSCNLLSVYSNTVTVTVTQLSVAPTSISGTTNICNGGSTTLTQVGGSLGGGANYQWFTGSCGGTPFSTNSSVTVSPTTTTTYYVRASGTCNTTTCASVTVTVDQFTTASAGSDFSICNSTSTNLAGNTPTTGVGTWSIVSGCGGCTFGNANSPTSSLNSIPAGTSTVRWTLPNGLCADSQDDVTITRDVFVAATAGTDQTFCETTSANISGSTPTTGVGTWSIVGGCGGCSIVNVNSPNTTVNNLPYGANTLRWTLPNGSCSDSQDDVIITRNQTDNANFAYGSTSYCKNAGTNPTPTISGLAGGTFSASSPNLVFVSTSTGQIDLTASVAGGPYTVTYLTNGPCPNTATFQVTIVAAGISTFNYGSASYCQNTTDPTPTVSVLGGTFSAIPSGLSFNPATGVIDVSASTANTYTVTYNSGGPCPSTTSQTVTIVATDDASFSYGSASYCKNAGTDPTPTVTGLAGGGFTVSSPNLVINNATGQIDLNASVAGGPYTVTYTTVGPCPNTATFQVTILPAGNSNFSYAQNTYCKNAANPTPSIQAPGGNFTSSSPNLVVDPSTGEIDLNASVAGGPYTVTYFSTNPCQTSSTFTINITPADDASFTYSTNSYCTNGVNPVPTITGLAGGSFTSSSPNLFVNSSTGEISLSASVAGGPYTITYSTVGACPNTATFQVSLTAGDNPAFSYSQATYCQNAGTNPVANVTGLPGGVFTSTPAGLVIDGSTGEIDLVASTTGITYTVTYTTTGACVASESHTVSITDADNSSFAFADATICINGTNPTPTITGLSGGIFSSSPAGLDIDASTGTIDLSNSTVNTPFTVTYTTTGACPTFTQQSIILLPAPVVSFSGLDPDYCINEGTVTLSGSPAGGTFSGLGIIGNTFSPTLTVAGTHVITYNYTDANQCSNSTTQSVLINGLPFISLSGLGTSYCIDDATPVPLNISPSGGTLSGSTGISGTDFIPANAGTGFITITYSYTDGNTCTNTTSQSTVVNALPVVGISGLANAYCVDAAPANLTGIPTGGTFSGTGISGNIFDPATAGIGTFTITYDYTDANSCSNSTTQNVTVNDLPSLSIVGLGNAYCEDANPVNLIGTPPGGSFSGIGVSNNQLFPSIVGGNQTLVTYSYTDGLSCSNTTSQLVTINDLPTVSFSGLASQYCVSASPVSLAGSPLSGTFSGPGVSGTTFDPATAGVGTHTITYTYTDGSTSCTNSTTQTVVVYGLPNVAISNLAPAYCVSVTNVPLTGIPSGGTFSGTGVTGNTFDPSAAGQGTYTITYTYTDGNSCSNTTSQQVAVNNLPTLSIAGLAAAYCESSPAASISGLPAGGTFSGTGISGNTFNPSITGPGTFNVTYAYTDGNSCSNTITQSVVVNTLPVVSFTGVNPNGYCVSNSTPQPLTGSPAGGTFSGVGVSGTDFIPSVAGVGTFTITYNYTDGNSCANSTTQNVTVYDLPTVAISNVGSAYCVSETNVPLTGIPSGGTFSGTGVSGNTFNPSAAGQGNHTITYTYTDGNSCSNSINQTIVVNPLPTLSISGLAASYCESSPAAGISGLPAGGTFSGTGISGNTFNPSITGPGTFNVTYAYTDGNSCSNTITQSVVVNTLPVVSFTGINPNGYCVSNTTPQPLTGSPLGGTFSGVGVSAGAFTPSVAGVGTFTITYNYTDGNSCANSTTQTVTVHALPTVAISNVAPAYCVSVTNVPLSGIPSGGTFSGPGVTGNTFNPSVVGQGNHIITYTYSDGNNCSNSVSQTIIVNPLPQPTISGLAAAYCVDAAPVSIGGAPSGGTFSGTGMSGSTFNPALAGAGTYNITYTYTDGNTCTNSVTQSVVVNALPVVNFSGLNATYCIGNTTPQPLTGLPSGGTFSGTGVSGNNFTPSASGVGIHVITYTYTDGNTCTNSTTQSVTVYDFPQVAITNLGAQYCITAGVQTLSGLPSGGTFAGPGVTGVSFDPAAAGVGVHNITYSYSDQNGCANTATQQVQVYAQPTVTLTGLGSTYCSNANQVTFTGTPTGGNFSGPGVSGNTFFPNIAGPGTHTVTYSYTDGNGCGNTATQTVVVNAAPAPVISGLANAYCINAGTVTFTTTPGGGTSSGAGVTGNTFDPQIAGPGPHTITYTITDGNNCTGTTSTQVIVNPLPTVGFAGLLNSYCTSSPDVIMTAFPAGGQFTGPGVSGNVFSPSQAGPGTFTVNYSFTDNNLCSNSYSQFVTVNPAPVVTFSGLGTEYCENANPVALTGNPTGGTFSGPGVTGNNFDPLFAGPGTHTISYSYTTNNGCSGSSSQQVTVNPLPVVSITGLAPSYCVNATPIQLTGTPSNGTFTGNGVANNVFTPANASIGQNYITYTFTDGNSCSASTQASVIVTPLDNPTFFYGQGSYCQTGSNDPTPTVAGTLGGSFSAAPSGLAINASTGLIDLSSSTPGCYTVTYNTNGTCSASSTFSVCITNGANAAFSYGSSSFCNNLTNPTPNILGDFGGSFSATNNLIINSITGEINLANSPTGTFDVTYTVGGSCPGAQTVSVTINQADNGDFSYPLYTYCQTSNLTPTPTINGNLGGTFSGSPGLSISPVNGQINLLASQQGLQTITYTTNGTCPATVSQNIFINNGPVADITTNGPTTFCFGGTVLLDAGPGYFSYSWNTGVGTQIISASTSDNYIVTVTDSSGCTSGDTIAVLVIQPPNATFTYSSFGLLTNFTNLSDNGQSYLWSFGDGSPNSIDPNPVHTYTDDGTYQVTLVVTNICGVDSVTIPVTVFKNSLNENTVVSSFNLYPNPSEGNVTVTFDVANKQDLAITLTDVTGRLILSEAVSDYSGNFNKQYNFSTLDRGVYLYSIRTKNGVITKRIVLN